MAKSRFVDCPNGMKKTRTIKKTFSLLQEFPSGSVRNFVLSVESPLGPLLYLRVWHDNTGYKKKASWYLNMINVMDLHTGEK
jgi:PLAT/LH2 domain